MAKRKRLTPARPDYLGEAPALETKGLSPAGVGRNPPPIAQVAGDTSAQAALEELTEELRTARAGGRMVQSLPLGMVDEAHLVRDRMAVDDAEMMALTESLRMRGQQTPIEVVELEQGRFGLISGWRRLSALRALFAETGETRFTTVQALLRRPDSAADAYLAMVEENEIRVGLSYYERARIAARAAEQGVYQDEASALRGLFASASRAKRSKIGSFMVLYHELDDCLSFASTIPERLGLALVKALKEDPQMTRRLTDALRRQTPQTAAEEAAFLKQALEIDTKPQKKAQKPVSENIGDIRLDISRNGDRLVLSGGGVSDNFAEKLRAWLRAQT
ncbi:ParB/RepB/Spo0J family partition protein [Ruegeria arenilitoris]|uniref:ParB/RepB/Spo0J family partition protein n=1 Tax=Ruegeria arenilitoris TaxID=1173585 RepID=UPI003C7975B9